MSWKLKRTRNGYINHSPAYVEEKMKDIINRAKNITKMQNCEVEGYENEIKSDLLFIKDYVEFFLRDYVDGKYDAIVELEYHLMTEEDK